MGTTIYRDACPLIPKAQAKKCIICGRVLWREERRFNSVGSTCVVVNRGGEILGRAPSHTKDTKGPRCFMKKACAARKET